MNTLKIFRLFLAASIVLAVMGAFFDTLVPDIIPRAIDDAYIEHVATDRSQSWLALAGVVSVGWAMAGIAAVVGLLRLKRWSRRLAFWVTVTGLALMPILFGVSVVSGWSYMLGELSTSLWAAALAMAYFSELKTHFENPVSLGRNPIAPNASV